MESMAQAEVRDWGSGTRVDAGHQKSMTSVENRDPVRKYSPGKRRPVAQSEVAKLMTRVEAESQEEDGEGGMDTRKEEGKKA